MKTVLLKNGCIGSTHNDALTGESVLVSYWTKDKSYIETFGEAVEVLADGDADND
jgi:hypothetical protein